MFKGALQYQEKLKNYQRQSEINCIKAFFEKKCSESTFLKMDTAELFLISNGRAFHSVGPCHGERFCAICFHDIRQS